MIKRGKRPVATEFGHRVLMVEDAAGFLVHVEVMGTSVQDVVMVKLTISAIQERLEEKVKQASFDRGFWSPENLIDLMAAVELACLPAKGPVVAEDQTDEFIAACHHHAGIESKIGALQHGNGQARCGDKGKVGLGLVVQSKEYRSEIPHLWLRAPQFYTTCQNAQNVPRMWNGYILKRGNPSAVRTKARGGQTRHESKVGEERWQEGAGKACALIHPEGMAQVVPKMSDSDSHPQDEMRLRISVLTMIICSIGQRRASVNRPTCGSTDRRKCPHDRYLHVG